MVWRPGLAQWIAAGEVADLFRGPSLARAEMGRLDQVAAALGNPTRRTLQKRLRGEMRKFAVMFLYLWILFALFALHRAFVLEEHHVIDYQAHGLAIVNALIFAKVMLLAEALHLGTWIHGKPLVWSVIYKSTAFAVVLISFHIVERTLIGTVHF